MIPCMAEQAYLRIGELSRRTGVSPELLRAWERRYGLLRPERTDGGFRLYSHDDLRRVEAMREQLARGVSAAQAAVLAASPAPAAAVEPVSADVGEALQRALGALDDAAAQAAFDDLLGRYSLDGILRDVVLPYLHDLGERWSRGDATVAQEHFASVLLRGRLLGLARGWDQGSGPRAVLACAPGELHDLSLIVFGLALRRHGWRITYLGPDTPLRSVAETADALEPEIVVVVAIVSPALSGESEALAALAAARALALAGAAAGEELARATGARWLAGDPVTEADRIAQALTLTAASQGGGSASAGQSPG
jgi:MerR family transcriptional regulator, light-induced transcriptional regulator